MYLYLMTIRYKNSYQLNCIQIVIILFILLTIFILEASSLLSSAAATVQSAVTVMMYGSLAVNIVMASSLQFLWGMINALQLIVNVPLFTLNMPANASYFFNLLVNIMNFNVIPTSQIESYFYNMVDSSPLNSAFD
jgi:hypothetical protein